MSRLHAELSRLYAWHGPAATATGSGSASFATAPAATLAAGAPGPAAPAAAPAAGLPAGLEPHAKPENEADRAAGRADGLQDHGPVRCLVLALGAPAEWPALAPLWRGVQAELDWPSPAIAVNGINAFELWFSLAQPVPVAEAARVLQGLRQRFLGQVAPARVRCWPDPGRFDAPPVPLPGERAPGRWSAFVAPDLAAVFGDDASLDMPPGEEAQADLLARLGSVSAAGWQAALSVVAAPRAHASLPSMAAAGGSVTAGGTPTTAPDAGGSVSAADHTASTRDDAAASDARRFLRAVLNDETVPLALRIEAAKALLQAPAGRAGP